MAGLSVHGGDVECRGLRVVHIIPYPTAGKSAARVTKPDGLPTARLGQANRDMLFPQSYFLIYRVSYQPLFQDGGRPRPKEVGAFPSCGASTSISIISGHNRRRLHP